ncbi:MAG: flagellar assembly peptidoglycan hydrolase FlgJ [Exilibacterium sp.]
MISDQTAIAQLQSQLQARDSYTDLKGLQNLKQLGQQDQDQALRQLSRQFESLFLNMMLKSMRSASDVFGKDNELNSSEMKLHQEMFDHQLALNLSKGRGLGLADTLYRQLKGQYGSNSAAADSVKPENTQSTTSGADASRSDVSRSDASRFGASRSDSSRSDVSRFDASRSDISRSDISRSDLSRSERSAVDNAPAAASPANRQAIAANPEAFVDALSPYARAAAEQLGVDPGVLIAQAALETGWGQHVLHDSAGNSSFNLFNIKADSHWRGERINVTTVEFKDGLAVREKADFRRYDGLQQSFADYVDFLTSSSRYQPALAAGTDAEDYMRALQRAGYATDPNYADKVLRIADTLPSGVRIAYGQ